MFRDPATYPRHDSPEIELEHGAKQGLLGDCHLQDHKPRPRLQHSRRLRQPEIEINQVSDPPSNHRAVE
jgi:hypothetical protein